MPPFTSNPHVPVKTRTDHARVEEAIRRLADLRVDIGSAFKEHSVKECAHKDSSAR